MHYLALIALIFLAPIAGAAEGPMQTRVREAVVAALGGAVSLDDVALSPSLRLSDCAAPLVASATGQRNVEVRCPDTPGWKVYVPVRVSRVASVVVATGPIRAGSAIDAGQLTVQKRDLTSVDGTGFGSPQEVIGKVAKRGLPPGAVILTRDLAAEIAVRRGDPVVIESVAGTASVSMDGKALTNATLGGSVTVENVASRKVVRGVLVEVGRVQVGMR